MLYERWRQVAAQYRNETALRDVASGRNWSFEQLAKEAEQLTLSEGPVVFAHGHSPAFILSVLRAWRDERALCPLESGQSAPALSALPPGCVHLKLTSGSTGKPRLVALTAPQLAADPANIIATMGLRADWPNLGVISLAHSYGFANLVLPLLLHGIPLILVPAPLPESVRHAAASVPDITLPAVPALWRAWHETDAIPPNVRLAISAGAPLPLPLEEVVFQARGLKIHNFLGASECGGIAYDRTTTPRTDATCVGTAMEQVDLSVGDDGCLQVRSKAVGATYWPDADDHLSAGCFRTSDLVELRESGVHLRGRASDLINVAGRKVSPETIERALQQHPAVRECLVVGLPSTDADRSETIVAIVATRTPATGEDLRQFLSHSLPAWQLPREWKWVDGFEVNQRGKLSRAEWRQRLA